MFDRRLVTNLDWGFVGLILLTASIGIVNLYSATSGWDSSSPPLYIKQCLWLGVGVLVMAAVAMFNSRHLLHLGPGAYAVCTAVLIAVFILGETNMGATRWLDVGLFNLQPSEIMKPVIVIVLAQYFSRHERQDGHSLRDLIVPGITLLIPTALIIKQPDLGTGMMLLFIGATMALFSGIRPKTLAFISSACVTLAAGGWFLLHEYQRARIRTFLNPEHDPLGSGYHIIQSKIAIGSGGFWGKGFMQGSQSQLSFLPERHTDFVFSVFAEEWGMFGALILLALYVLIIFRGILVAHKAANNFGMYLTIGATSIIFWHAIVNLCMVMGLLPVVGVPLPLFSYGGTNMVTTMVAAGMILNVSMRRFML
ncbi:MAG: rod shape-determining protein RodA [Desulfuromonadaceae bacterium]|nr:rod shape-determining protein RodA [Desulfuromonas sp.]MDY0185447.1 rod shape-determining protein RodA [Desulfuromonadaceae bacterium]